MFYYQYLCNAVYRTHENRLINFDSAITIRSGFIASIKPLPHVTANFPATSTYLTGFHCWLETMNLCAISFIFLRKKRARLLYAKL